MAAHLTIRVGLSGSRWIRLQEHRSWCWPGRGEGWRKDPTENQLNLIPDAFPEMGYSIDATEFELSGETGEARS